MAKGARKKTKWVLLTTTATTAEKEADAPTKLPWETKQPRTAIPSSEDCNTTAQQNNGQNQEKHQQEQEQRNNSSSAYSNNAAHGYRTSQHHSYSHHHRSNYSRSHHYSSGSSRKSHYGGGGGYRSNASTAEARNEQTSSVTINEDEYTKITTPRQDVLFKKGYLSRPKKPVSSENGLVNGSSSTTTDGSDIATGSGSVSTAESITSDSTYLTDGLFMDPYPTPYPYFGYIDQSGVLVMNGFAVDSNGYSYMNGGQTYIYPPNYNLSQSQTFEDGASQSGEDVLLQQTADPSEELPTTSSDVPSASEDSEEQKPKPEEHEEEDQQMTPQQQQQFLAPYANGYDYAQFYNNLYYPGCVMAPFPVVDNGMYYDQFEMPSDNHYEFKKHRKWHRNWEEYPVQMHGDTMTDESYQDPSFLSSPQAEEPVSTTTTEVPVTAAQPEQTQPVPSSAPRRQPAANSHKTSSQQQPPKTAASKPSVEGSQPTAAAIAKPPKPAQSQKIRKKDLIESTRAFAEQNIDLSKPTYLQKVQKESTSAWKTVCNGKEVAIEDDRAESQPKPKMEVIEEAPETVASETVASSVVAVTEPKPIESKPKRGKKTAKGKGKKQKRQSVGQQQQKGFEVIEPEFSAVSRIVASKVEVVGEDSSDGEHDQEAAIEEEVVVKQDQFEVESVMLKDEDSVTVIEAEAEEDLELMLHDVQLTDIHVDEESVAVSEDHVEEEAITEQSDLPKVIESVIEEKVISEDPAPTSEEPPLTSENPVSKEGDQMIAPSDEEISCTSPISCSVDEGDKEEEIEDFRHFSGEEDGDQTVDSGVQSPAAFISPTTAAAAAAAAIEEKKERSYSGSGLHVTDAVTKWLSESLNSTIRLEEMFVLPENPELLNRITQQFHVFSFEDSLALSSDTYSTSSGSGDEADDADSDYMSDVQVKKAQKTESQKDQLAKQTANDLRSATEDHSNCKQKRCIIM